ncbi:DsbA family protein [uncultured Sphingomonas sp.]|uniref:DsbA family protein n=1 Tax=uncultured Sphingomonas sp. TaxID=158754 RepID=UPI0035CB1C7E
MNRRPFLLTALAGAALGAGAVWGVDRLGPGGAVGPQVRAYLLGHPEVVEQAIQGMQAMQTARLVAAHRDDIVIPYAGAWAGDPKGDVTVVEYFDYNCSYCRASLPVLAQLLRDDPHIRIVYRELPILAETSVDAARASLAAARQGRYAAFHQALYAAGPVSAATIAAAARAAHVDPARVPADADAELHRNRAAYAALGMGGTPSWVVGDRVLSGIQPIETLEAAVAAARGK